MNTTRALIGAAVLAAAGGAAVVSQGGPHVVRAEWDRPLGCEMRMPDGGTEDVFPRTIRLEDAVGATCLDAGWSL